MACNTLPYKIAALREAHRLKSYEPFPRPIPLTDFIERNSVAIKEELIRDAPKHYPFVLWGQQKKVTHGQGVYLSRCTPKLYALIRADVAEGMARTAAHSATVRYWAMAFGEGGRLWDECREKGIAAVGWDEFKLGDLAKYPNRESIQQILIERRNAPGPTPSNDALCLFQFSHEMAIGDYIVAKVGRRRLLGLQVV